MEPNKEHLKLWVEDLESGKHEQVQGFLSAQTDKGTWGYCCLGRACEIAMAHGVDVNRHLNNSDGEFMFYDDEASYPPFTVSDWFGVDDLDLIKYASYNDQGETFKDIATYIRKDFDIE